ncbi:phage antirepressor N-terminal domain-containing protein [Thermodesulfobacteriota bacterium]
MTDSTLQAVDFLGHQINCVQDDDGTPYVPLNWLCEILGVDRNRHRKAVKDDGLYEWKMVPVKGADGRHRKMFCLPLEEIFFWAYTVDSSTVKPEIRESFLQYQEESTMALLHAQRHGIAFNPRKDAHEIETFVRESVERSLEQMILEHLDPRLRKSVLFEAELKLLGRFSDEPPAYREKADECMQIAIDRYFDWVAEYERNAAHVMSH